MEKEKLYHIALDDYEHGVVIRSLNDEKGPHRGSRQLHPPDADGGYQHRRKRS